MTREIKFRAWSKLDKKLWPVLNLDTFAGYVNFGAVGDDKACNTTAALQNVILEQFTGLKDKNGKEIYEGDIVMTLIGYAKKVEWNTTQNGWNVRQTYKGYKRENLLEVIGNIHEHGNLLTN